MTREQMIAWLVLEGWEPCVSRGGRDDWIGVQKIDGSLVYKRGGPARRRRMGSSGPDLVARKWRDTTSWDSVGLPLPNIVKYIQGSNL